MVLITGESVIKLVPCNEEAEVVFFLPYVELLVAIEMV
jgi:hypothetical protein